MDRQDVGLAQPARPRIDILGQDHDAGAEPGRMQSGRDRILPVLERQGSARDQSVVLGSVRLNEEQATHLALRCG